MSLIFDKATIESFKFHKTPNKVLVKPSRGNNEVILPGGVKIFLDNRFGKEKHAPTTGTVVAHCGKLMPSRMQWETENELQVGDHIVYSFESAMYAMEEMHGRVILDTDNEPYFLIDYDDIFCIKREETVIPINGYLLVSPIDLKQDQHFSIVRENNSSTTYGTVACVGKRNTRYFFGDLVRDDVFDFEEPVNIGDIVVFNRDSDIPVEYPLHKSLANGSGKNFFRLQRRDIDAIIPHSEKHKFGI